MLSKIKHYIHQKTLKAIPHAIFKSYLYYFSLVWAQNLTLQKDCLLLQKKGLRLTLFLRRDAHVNTLFKDCNILEFHAVIRLHLRTLSWCINLSNMNFLNHLIPGLHFPQYFITTTQGGPIKVVLMYLLTEQNYMEEILLVLVQFSPGIIFKTFIEIFHFISTNSLKKLLTLHFWENIFEECLSYFICFYLL